MNYELGIKKNEGGQLLVEILIVIAAVAVIAGISAQMLIVSMRSNKVSGERNVALGLVEETFETVRNTAAERWQDVYNQTKGSAQYYPKQVSGKWTIASSSENVIVSGITFTRYFTIDNVSRDPSSRSIEATYNASNDDPSTQKITVTVSWSDAEPIVSREYVMRWRNKACAQTNWSGGQSGSTSTCPATVYGGTDGNIDSSTAGILKLAP